MRRRCEAVVVARGGQTSYWTLQTSILHDNFSLSMICSDNDVNFFLLILTYLLCPYESKLYDFCRFFFLYVKNVEHQTLVSFLLLASIYTNGKKFAF
jgi:uncharacterized membrane protein